MKKLTLCSFLMMFFVVMPSWSSPPALTYQGRIVRTDGTALEHHSISFIFQILNPAGHCVIYQEQVTGVDLTNSKGVFDVPIGTGSVSWPTTGSFSVLDSFNNNTMFSCGVCSGYTCSAGSSTYSASGGHGRILRVQFHDGSGWKTISPDNIIRSVPFAGYSVSAQKLGTHDSSAFVLKGEVNGNATCDAGRFLTWNAATRSFGCATAPAGGGGGGLASVTSANGYLSVTDGTTAPILTLNVGTVAGTVAAGDDSRIVNALQSGAAAGGDLSGTYPNPVIANNAITTVKINNNAVTSAKIADGAVGLLDLAAGSADGQVLRFNGSQWQHSKLDFSDLVNTNGLSPWPADSCNAGEFLTWISTTDIFDCVPLTSSMVATALGYTPLTSARTITAGTGLTGGGDLTANRTLSVNVGTGANQIPQLDGSGKLNSSVIPVLDGSSLANTPAGNISATTTQAAINELDTEKVSKAGDTMTGALNLPANGLAVGSDQLVVSGGNVGIGTTSSDSKLHVYDVTNIASSPTMTSSVPFKIADTVSALLMDSNQIESVGSALYINHRATGGTGQDIYLAAGGGKIMLPGSGIWNAAGNVGIGTTNPNRALYVSKSDSSTYASSSASLTTPLQSSSAGAWVQNAASLDSSGSYVGLGTLADDGTTRAGYVGMVGGGSTSFSYGALAFGGRSGTAAYSERMRIDLGTGNVGIGTTVPTEKLVVAGDTYSTVESNVASSSANPGFAGRRSQGTQAAPVAVLQDDVLNSVIGIGYNGSGWNQAAKISMAVDGPTVGPSDMPGRISFFTTTDGTSSPTEKMRISNSGNVGIGTTNPTTKLEVAGVVKATGFEGPLTSTSTSVGAGTNASPSMTFSGDTNTGFYNGSADTINVAAGGANIFNFSSSGLVSPTTGGAAMTTANGTATAPTFSFSGDTDTGWFRPEADTMAASTAGVERMRISSTGFVGIGTTDPGHILHVAAQGSRFGGASGDMSLPTVSNTNLLFHNISATNWSGIGDDSGGSMYFVTGAAGHTSGTRMTISPAGNVGIGTISPSALLDVRGNLATGSIFGGAGAGKILSIYPAQTPSNAGSSGNYVRFMNSSNGSSWSESMRIDSTGNVGIGVVAPDTPLDARKEDTNNASLVDVLSLYHTTSGTAAPGIGTGIVLGTERADGAVSTAAGIYGLYTGVGTGSGTNGALAFYTRTDSSTFTEKMRVDTSGNVGVGTASPAANLHVYRTAASTPLGIFRDQTAANNFSDVSIEAYKPGLAFKDISTSSADFRVGVELNKLIFSVDTDDDETKDSDSNFDDLNALAITSTGNIGIGTTAPASKLTVFEGDLSISRSTANTAAVNISRAAGQFGLVNFQTAGSRRWHVGIDSSAEAGANVGSNFYINRADDSGVYIDTSLQIMRSSGNIILAPNNGNVGIGTTNPIDKLHVSGGSLSLDNTYALGIKDTGGISRAVARLDASNNLTFGPLAGVNNMIFQMGTEKMRIDQAGNVGIGTTNPGTTRLAVTTTATSGNIASFTSTGAGGAGCSIAWNGTSCSSDITLKENIVDLDKSLALNDLLKVVPVHFTWKADKEHRVQTGFIAQQLESIFPEFVTTDDNGKKQVNYAHFVSVLTASVQELYLKWSKELQNTRRDLASLNQKLESENKTLKERLGKIEQENLEIKSWICAQSPKSKICAPSSK